MDRYCTDDQPVDNEIAFWRGFITWWAREKAAPVPARAWDALALAEEQQTTLDEKFTRKDCDRAGGVFRPGASITATAGGRRQRD